MRTRRTDFAEFYRRYNDDCLRTVLVSVGDRHTAQDLVAEAFARAWASWRTVSALPGTSPLLPAAGSASPGSGLGVAAAYQATQAAA